MKEIFSFISEDNLYIVSENKEKQLSLEAVNNYKKVLKELNSSDSWKKDKENSLEAVLGSLDNNIKTIQVSNCKLINENQLIYSAILENSGGIYYKNDFLTMGYEELILRDSNLNLYEFDFINNKIVGVLGRENFRKDLAIINITHGKNINPITSGESIDRNPVFYTENIIYYDSSGIGFDANGNFAEFGQRNIMKLDLSNGNLTEELSNNKYDFFKPIIDNENNLLCIKKPYKEEKNTNLFLNFILGPFKLIKAIISYLDFFTRNYSGETIINSNGNVLSKSKERSEKEIFIENNLINIEENLKNNINNKEKFPGVIPSSWKLIKIINNKEVIIKNGVLDFNVNKNNEIIYSNGKDIIKINKDGKEKKITSKPFPKNINIL